MDLDTGILSSPTGQNSLRSCPCMNWVTDALWPITAWLWAMKWRRLVTYHYEHLFLLYLGTKAGSDLYTWCSHTSNALFQNANPVVGTLVLRDHGKWNRFRQESYKEKTFCNYVNHTIFKLLWGYLQNISLEIKEFLNVFSISELNFD